MSGGQRTAAIDAGVGRIEAAGEVCASTTIVLDVLTEHKTNRRVVVGGRSQLGAVGLWVLATGAKQ